jgi:hypothetical protein
MTVQRFLQSGEAEMFKGGVHAAVGILAIVCGVYNAAAWTMRRERHLGVNAIVYTGLALWEVSHVRRHGQRASKDKSPQHPAAAAVVREEERLRAAAAAVA